MLCLLFCVVVFTAAECCGDELTFFGTRLAKDVIEDLETAYSLSHPDGIGYEAVSYEDLRVHMSEGDLVITDSMQYLPAPNTSWVFEMFGFPIVLVYDDNSIVNLGLSQQVLVDIFRGVLTRWNDPVLVALNPSVVLPDEPITLVVPDSSLLDYFFLGLSVFAQQIVNRSALETGNATVVQVDIDDVCRRVSVEPFSLGISWMGDALVYGTPMARLQNAAGNFADPATGIASAMTEFRILQHEAEDAGEDPWALRAFNMPGRISWPLVGVVTLVLPKEMTSCDEMKTARDFVLWVLLEDKTQPLMRLLGWEPATTLDLLGNGLGMSAISDPARDIEEELNSVVCDTGTRVVELLHTIGSSNVFWPLVVKLLAGYSTVNNFVGLTSVSTNISTLLTRMTEGESEDDVDIALTWQPLIDIFPTLHAVPVLMGTVTPLVNLGNLTLTLTVSLLTRIFSGEITTWNDHRIQSLNPTVKLPQETIVVLAAPIGYVDGVTAMFASLLENENSSFSWSHVNTSISETELAHHVKFTNYSISYAFGHLLPEDDLILVPSMIGKAGRVTELSTLHSCWRSTDDRDCWPLSIPLAFAIRPASGDITCEHQKLAVDFLDWVLHNNVELEPFLIPNPKFRSPFGAAEYCNGRSLLRTEAEPQLLAHAVVVLVRVVCGIGITWTIVHAAALIVARNVGELKSASVLFGFLAVGGVFLMFLAPLLIVTNEPTNFKCGIAEWSLVLGFSLTYGSLFAKLYRLYKIFTSRSLIVPRLGNRKLLMILAVLLCVDIVVLVIESATDLLEVGTFDVLVPSNEDLVTGFRKLRWHICDYELDDVPITVLFTFKLAIAAAGAFMAFAIRQVDRRFASAAALGWCFYNIFLAVLIIVLLSTAFRDTTNPATNLAIVVFGGLWILVVTLVTLAFDSNVFFTFHLVAKFVREKFQSHSETDAQKKQGDGETPEGSVKRSNTSTIFVVNREMFPSKYDDFDPELLEKILDELNFQRTAVRRALLNRGASVSVSTPAVQMAALASDQSRQSQVAMRAPERTSERKGDETPPPKSRTVSQNLSTLSQE